MFDSRIGLEVARTFVAEGHFVDLFDIDTVKLEGTARELVSGDNI